MSMVCRVTVEILKGMNWSFLFGLIAGSSLYATIKWINDSRKRRKDQPQEDYCLFFSPMTLRLQCCSENNLTCEALSCPACNHKRFLSLIKTTTSHLDVCVYLITSDEITKALLNLFYRGIFIRIIADKDMNEQASHSKMNVFMKEHVPIKLITAGEIMHNKFMIIDGKVLVTGSFNYTTQATYHNFESGVVIHNEKIVKEFSNYFNEIWLS